MKKLLMVSGLTALLCGVQFANAGMVFNAGFATPGGHDLIVETDEELEAGAGVYGSFGLVHKRTDSPWSCQAMLGIKVNAVEFTGGEADIRAFPVHLMGFYQHKNFRYGAGLTYDLSIELDITGNNPRTVNFKNAPGIALEMNHLFHKRWFWGLRYTDMDYKEKGSGEKFNASNLGGHVGMFF